MWGGEKGMSGWEREMMGAVDEVLIPDWLTTPADRAKWLTLSDRDRSDWARAHGSAVASSAAAAAAEAAGHAQEQVQALEEAYSSLKASLPASAPSPIPDRRWMLWAGGAALVGYLVLRRGGRKVKKVHRK
jgi:hypothetical protein